MRAVFTLVASVIFYSYHLWATSAKNFEWCQSRVTLQVNAYYFDALFCHMMYYFVRWRMVLNKHFHTTENAFTRSVRPEMCCTEKECHSTCLDLLSRDTLCRQTFVDTWPSYPNMRFEFPIPVWRSDWTVGVLLQIKDCSVVRACSSCTPISATYVLKDLSSCIRALWCWSEYWLLSSTEEKL